MPSLKSHLVALYLKYTRKRAFASAESIRAWAAWSRARSTHRPPDILRNRLQIAEREVDGIPVYEVTPPALKSDLHIIYMHGGAYLFEITSYHWKLIAEMAERLGVRATVPIYKLAPDHTFPAIFGPVRTVCGEVFRYTAPEKVVFMGDSAGGNMAVVLTMMAAEEGLPIPGHHVLISPGLDMSLQNPALYEAEKLDPWLGIEGGKEAIRLYAPGMETTDWRISPIFGDLSVLPRTLILSGTRDVLSPDTVIFVEKARAAGVDIELMLEPGMIHVWPLIDMPEARRARDRIVTFLSETEPAG